MSKVIDFKNSPMLEPTIKLDRVAQIRWKALAEHACASRVVNAADLLTCYCLVFSRLQQAESRLKIEDLLIESQRGGDRVNPLHRISLDCLSELRQLARALGFDKKIDGKTQGDREAKARRILDQKS